MEKRLCKACSDGENRREATRASNNKKKKEQIKLTNDCPTPLCTMPYAHTHTNTHMIYNTPTQHCQRQGGESEREACKVDPVH